jgi:hypothetical protein
MPKRCCKCGRFMTHDSTACAGCGAPSRRRKNANGRVVSPVGHPRQEHGPVALVHVIPHQDSENMLVIDVLARQLQNDILSLLNLGIKMDKGAAAATGAGLGVGVVRAFAGHWLSAAIAGGAVLLACGAMRGYKWVKLRQVQNKWRDLLLQMSETETMLFAQTMHARYPALFQQLQMLLTAGPS